MNRRFIIRSAASLIALGYVPKAIAKNDMYAKLREDLKEALSFYAFEYNTPETRSNVRIALGDVLRSNYIESDRSLVICDHINNPPAIIDGNQLVASIILYDSWDPVHGFDVKIDQYGTHIRDIDCIIS